MAVNAPVAAVKRALQCALPVYSLRKRIIGIRFQRGFVELELILRRVTVSRAVSASRGLFSARAHGASRRNSVIQQFVSIQLSSRTHTARLSKNV